MEIPLLIIGTAEDGPDGSPTQPSSFEEAMAMFGGWRYETVTLTAASTSVTLSKPVWGYEVLTYGLSSRGEIIEFPLFNLSASGALLRFDPPGVSGDLLVQYASEPAETDVLPALREVLRQGAPMPYLLRIPGTRSGISLGPLKLLARYSGDYYNGISVISSGGYLTITAPDSFGLRVFSYPTSSIEAMAAAINTDFERGGHPLQATDVDRAGTVPTGTWATTGGAAGAFNSGALAAALDSTEQEGVSAVLLCGGSDAARCREALDALDPDVYPTLVFAGSPASGRTGLATQDYFSTVSAFGIRDPRLFFVPGWGLTPVPGSRDRWSSLAPTFAGLWARGDRAPTHEDAGLNLIHPYWDRSQVRTLGERFPVFTKFIQTGHAPYSSRPTDGKDPYHMKVVSDLARRLHGVLDRYYGEPAVPEGEVSAEIAGALSGMTNVRDYTFEVEMYSNAIRVIVSVVRWGEVREIRFSLTSRRSRNAL